MNPFYVWLTVLFLAAVLAFNPYNTTTPYSCGIHRLAFDVTSVPIHKLIDKYSGRPIYQLKNVNRINAFEKLEDLHATL